jgi:hypothetical protein
MPDYSSTFSKYRAYNVTPDTLAGIVDLVTKFTEEPATTTIHLVDDHEVKDINLDALLNDSFVKAQRIQRIKIDSKKFVGPLFHYVTISFEPDLLKVVQVTISGDRDRSLATRRELETLLRGAEYWYSSLLLPRTMLFFQLSIFVPIIVIAVLAGLLTWLFGGEVRPNFITTWVFLPFAILLAAYFGFKDHVFPRLTFEIGRSADRIRYASYWRNFLLTSIAIGIVAKFAIDRLAK